MLGGIVGRWCWCSENGGRETDTELENREKMGSDFGGRDSLRGSMKSYRMTSETRECKSHAIADSRCSQARYGQESDFPFKQRVNTDIPGRQ